MQRCPGRRLGRRRRYVRITPLLGGCLGRQGSSGSESWAKTESSPEEQVLLESWQVGEYCSKGTARSRYSCRGGREVRAGGRDSNPRHETTVELWVIVCERQLCGETHICGGHR